MSVRFADMSHDEALGIPAAAGNRTEPVGGFAGGDGSVALRRFQNLFNPVEPQKAGKCRTVKAAGPKR